MASAGRILIMPKGAYDPNATYEMLDMVSHNGTTWLAKKTVSGVEPSSANGEYWHSMIDFDIANNLTTEDDGKVLDARQGKLLDEKKLDKSGGTLTGPLGLGGGMGFLHADNKYAALQAAKDGNNFRYIRLMNPIQEGFTTAQAVQWAETNNGVENVYNLFGEHNIDYLKQLLGLV